MQIINLGMTDLAQKNSLIGGSEIRLSPHTRHLCVIKYQLILNEYNSDKIILNTVTPRLTKIIRSGITFVSRNVISRRFL